MIGKHVKYKKGWDKTEYFVVDYVINKYPSDPMGEICIIKVFPIFHHRTRQLRTWQDLNKFNVLPD
jgi:hypothetical protein